MLRRAPDRDAVRVGRGEKRVRLDGEMRDHRKRVVVLDDEIGRGLVDVAPAELPLLQRVGAARADRSGAAPDPARAAPCVERRVDRQHRGQLLEVDANEPRSALSRRPRSLRRRRRRARLRTSSRPWQASGDRRRRGRSGEPGAARSRGREDAAHAWHAQRLIGMNCDDARVRARQRDQLHVQRIVERGCRPRIAARR